MSKYANYGQTQLLRDVSRTFALSIEELPDALQESTAVAYLLLRVSDILEDHLEMPVERKSQLLRTWADVLDQSAPVERLTQNITDLDGNDPEVYVAQNAQEVLARLYALPERVQGSIVSRVHKTTLGMARWQEHGPFMENEAALDDYMHEVAGRVGYLVTDLFAWYSPKINERKETLMPLSRECGLALQTVNVIRGMPKDYERGWVFVPQTYLQKVGLTRETLFDPENLDKAMQIVDMLADKADRHLGHGLTYVMTFPSRFHSIRLALMWPFFFAVRTLAVSRQNSAVLRSEAKIGRDEVRRIIVQTKILGWSNRWLARYQRRMARIPKNQASPTAPVQVPAQM